MRAIEFCWVFCLKLQKNWMKQTSSTVLTLEVLQATVHKYLTTNWHVNVTFHYTCVSSMLQLIHCYSILYYTTSTNDSSPGIFGRFLRPHVLQYLPPQRWMSSALAEPPCFLEQKIHASNRSSPALEYMTYATQPRSSLARLLKVESVSGTGGWVVSLRHENHISYSYIYMTYIYIYT